MRERDHDCHGQGLHEGPGLVGGYLERDIERLAASAYAAMARAVRDGITALLAVFKAPSPNDLLRNATVEEFLQTFLDQAGKFSEGCCQGCARIMRQSTVVPEIRSISWHSDC